MTDQPREIVPILFLGSDPRFINADVVPPQVAQQLEKSRGRDFRPSVRPADAPEIEVPKASSATAPASDSPGEQTSTSSQESPDSGADAGKGPNPDLPPVL